MTQSSFTWSTPPVNLRNAVKFSRLLPTVFEGVDVAGSVQHIVVGNFKVALDNYLDQKLPNLHLSGTEREYLLGWLGALGLMDSWRYIYPDGCAYTSPKRENRLDYCFLSVDRLQDRLDIVCHVRDRKWHTEDHIPVKFRLQAKIVPRGRPPPRRCPTWLLNYDSVQDYLRTSVNDLDADSRCFLVPTPVVY